MFPALTPAQVARIAAQGRVRLVREGEVLIEAGEQVVPFFVVTGEVNMISGRRALFRARVATALTESRPAARATKRAQ